MVYLKELFIKVDFEKKSAYVKKHAIYPVGKELIIELDCQHNVAYFSTYHKTN